MEPLPALLLMQSHLISDARLGIHSRWLKHEFKFGTFRIIRSMRSAWNGGMLIKTDKHNRQVFSLSKNMARRCSAASSENQRPKHISNKGNTKPETHNHKA
ncbi:hypothetical protein PMIN06_005243 [Paraphaeosphaeria minitans]